MRAANITVTLKRLAMSRDKNNAKSGAHEPSPLRRVGLTPKEFFALQAAPLIGGVPQTPTSTVAGVTFHDVTMTETVTLILLMLQKGVAPQQICTGNLDHLFLLQRDSAFRAAYDTAALCVPDGMPIVWLSRCPRRRALRRSAKANVAEAADAVAGSVGHPLRERVAGSDLFWELARASQSHGIRLFLLGGHPGAADDAAAKVLERYPGAQICGTYCPPHETFETSEEQEKIQRIITEAAPDILFVGLGAPKQEKWIAANKRRLGVPVSIGVGGTFEMAAGLVKRAPVWARKSGMEWAFRLVQDPARLWRRYVGNDMPFLMATLVRTVLDLPHPVPPGVTPAPRGAEGRLQTATNTTTSDAVTG